MMSSSLRMYRAQMRMGLRLYFRTPATIFWVFAFPVMMLVGLGFAFSVKNHDMARLLWVQSAPSTSSMDSLFQGALTEVGVSWEVVPVQAIAERRAAEPRSLVLQGQDGQYRLDLARPANATDSHPDALVQQAFLLARARADHRASAERIPTTGGERRSGSNGSYAAFLLPGLLGLNLLLMGIFSAGMVDVTMRQRGGYKRLATTPLPKHVFLSAQLSVRLIILVASAVVLLITGALTLGITNKGNYLSLLVLMLLGAACFISMGYLLASFARTTEIYSSLAKLVIMPFVLVSGVYFPLDGAPSWLRACADALPLTVLLEGLRAIFDDGAPIASQASRIAVLSTWTVVLFLLARKRFKWV